MKKVLITSKSCGSGIGREKVRELFGRRGIEADLCELKRAGDALGEYDGIIMGMDSFGEEEFVRAKKLKLIMKYGVGVENIDRISADKRGVLVKNMPGVNHDAVAEMALSLLLCTARRVAEGDRRVREGTWPRLLGTSLKGKTMGIVGTGAIGQTLAGYLEGFAMTLLGYDLFPDAGFEELGGSYVSFDELLRRSDFISIHVPLTESTYHMFDQTAFGKMKKSAVLINTARGAVVDENALKYALENGMIAGAGMDVFEKEPAWDSPLIGLERVVATPHIAASSRETMETMDRLCVKIMAESLFPAGSA